MPIDTSGVAEDKQAHPRYASSRWLKWWELSIPSVATSIWIYLRKQQKEAHFFLRLDLGCSVLFSDLTSLEGPLPLRLYPGYFDTGDKGFLC